MLDNIKSKYVVVFKKGPNLGDEEFKIDVEAGYLEDIVIQYTSKGYQVYDLFERLDLTERKLTNLMKKDKDSKHGKI